jgi:ribosomal 50S subunit-recycling heat shock protein
MKDAMGNESCRYYDIRVTKKRKDDNSLTWGKKSQITSGKVSINGVYVPQTAVDVANDTISVTHNEKRLTDSIKSETKPEPKGMLIYKAPKLKPAPRIRKKSVVLKIDPN